MKKTALETGDIVVLRNGQHGVVIKTEKEQYILYPEGGYDFFDDYNDDLTYAYSGGECDDTDIMQVYRAEHCAIGFSDYTDEEPIYEREESCECITKKNTEIDEDADNKNVATKNNNRIEILSQAFYGNRTGTEVREENIDCFILGHLSDLPFDPREIDRKVIPVPDSDSVVIIYNGIQEANFRAKFESDKSGYNPKPLAVIPEIGLEIYSRCIACRMTAEGEFESLCDEDYEMILKYFAE